jgi:glutathione peroxidase
VELSDVALTTLAGELTSLHRHRGKALLIVNVASTCGLTPQYGSLQQLYDRLKQWGFCVLAFPCNQFGEHEQGSGPEIAAFVAKEFGVTFPVFEKVDVKGPDCHPLFVELSEAPDVDGRGGEITWNFEKFVVTPELEVLARYRSLVDPQFVPLVNTIKSVLPDPVGDASRRVDLTARRVMRPRGPRRSR